MRGLASHRNHGRKLVEGVNNAKHHETEPNDEYRQSISGQSRPRADKETRTDGIINWNPAYVVDEVSDTASWLKGTPSGAVTLFSGSTLHVR